MEGNIFIADAAFHIFEFYCIRSILNLRLSLHNIKETTETGKSFLHHFHQLYENLDRTDEDSDIKSIHRKICG